MLKRKQCCELRLILPILFGIALMVAILQINTPSEFVSGQNDEKEEVLFDLVGGGGSVTEASVKGIRFDVGESVGRGFYGDFVVEGRGSQIPGDGLIDIYITDEQGWIDLWNEQEPAVKIVLTEGNSRGDLEGLVPNSGTWYVVYDRSDYTDYYAKTVDGWICRDLTPPDIVIQIEPSPWSGLIPINFTITDSHFPIHRIEITLDAIPIVPSFDNLDRGTSFSDTIPFNSSLWEDGYSLLQIKAWDRAGNYRTSSIRVEIRNMSNYAFWIIIGIGVLGGAFIVWRSYVGDLSQGAALIGILTIALLDASMYLVAVMGFGIENAIGLISGGLTFAGFAYAAAKFADKH
jgi:hypothetical protein